MSAERSAAPAAPIDPRLGALALLLIATCFASNHIAARLAFDHGTSIATAVAVRSFVTTFAVLGLLLVTRTPLALARSTVGRAILIGLLLTVQSYSLYGAVARLPVALALLTFNVFPILLAAIAWIVNGQRPGQRTLLAMPVILAGLALALNVFGFDRAAGATVAQRWSEIGVGVGFALTAASSFAVALFLTTRWLANVDGRLRACLMMATVGVVVVIVGNLLGMRAGGAQPVFGFPADAHGWFGLALLSVLYTIAFTSLFVLLPKLGAVNNSPILNFEPIAAMILGAVVLGQTVTPIQIVGALLVIGGIVFIATARRT